MQFVHFKLLVIFGIVLTYMYVPRLARLKDVEVQYDPSRGEPIHIYNASDTTKADFLLYQSTHLHQCLSPSVTD